MGLIESKDLPIPDDIGPKISQDKKCDIFNGISNSQYTKNESDTSADLSDESKSKDKSSFDNSSNDDSNKEDTSKDNILDLELSTQKEQLEKEIDVFIEEWFTDNNQVDLGNIKILNQKVDLIPDSMEKLIYKKALIIGITFIKKVLTESKITILNQEVSIHVKGL